MEKVKASEFVSNIAEATGLSKAKAAEVIAAVFGETKNQLKAGRAVSINGFGTFSVKERGARIARNPRTKETIEIPAQKTVALKPFAALKQELN